ncbi:syncytin-2-like [Bombina bombina]|uniref:syncytin-2-like n=1 Tax=Bombina bombina TaxID=8345 RepID=UPI00235AF6E3|nr:syncytin-2-like [Bombina bombina]
MSAWETDNAFVKAATNLYKVTNQTDSCWVCGYVPHGGKWGYPFVGFPITAHNLTQMINDDTMWNFTPIVNTDKGFEKDRVHLVNCVNHGVIMSHNLNGTSFHPSTLSQMPITVALIYNAATPVNATLLNIWDGSYLSFEYIRNFTAKYTEPHNTIRNWFWRNNRNIGKQTGASPEAKRKRFPSCPSVIKLPYGYYWLCERWAVKIIPCSHLSPCYLGYIFPALSIHDTLPNAKLRTRRASDFTVKTSTAEIATASWFPTAAVMRLYYKLNLFATLVDAAFNSTADAIESLTMRQEQIAQTALQNRMALDYLLAAEGGVCKRIGSSCCVFIWNNTGRIHHDLDTLHDIQSHIRKQPTGLFDGIDWTFGLSSWLGALGMKIIIGFAFLLFLFLAFFFIYKLTVCLINKLTSTHANPHHSFFHNVTAQPSRYKVLYIR